MSTKNQILDFEWVDVKSSLSLVDNQKYTFQCTGSFPIRVFESSTLPEVDVYGIQLEKNKLISVTPNNGLNIYAKVIAKGLKSNITVTEAV